MALGSVNSYEITGVEGMGNSLENGVHTVLWMFIHSTGETANSMFSHLKERETVVLVQADVG